MKRQRKVITIKVTRLKESIGHTQHQTGTGAHADSRTRRKLTRGAQKLSWRRECSL